MKVAMEDDSSTMTDMVQDFLVNYGYDYDKVADPEYARKVKELQKERARRDVERISKIVNPPRGPVEVSLPTWGKTHGHEERILVIDDDNIDDVEIYGMPGEVETSYSLPRVGETVEMSCPMCQAPMTCRLKDTETSYLKDIVEHYYTVAHKSCDCPDIYLNYGKSLRDLE
jgi:hypothetical protein